jgi:hypothetical protein
LGKIIELMSKREGVSTGKGTGFGDISIAL